MPEKEFLILVTFRDLSWPALGPDPYLVWGMCSNGILSIPLRLLWPSFEQKLSMLRLSLSHTEMPKFDLLPDLDPRLKVNLKILSTVERGDLIRISTVFKFFFHKQGTFLIICLCQSHDTYFGYVRMKNDKNTIFNVFFKT